MTFYDVQLSDGRSLGLRCDFATEALLFAYGLGHWDVRWFQVNEKREKAIKRAAQSLRWAAENLERSSSYLEFIQIHGGVDEDFLVACKKVNAGYRDTVERRTQYLHLLRSKR